MKRKPILPGISDPFGINHFKICKSPQDAKRKIKKTNLKLTFDMGRCIGKLLILLQIPDHLIDSTIHRIVKDWPFSYSCKRFWRRNQKFMKGIHFEISSKSETLILSIHSFLQELEKAATMHENVHEKDLVESLKFESTESLLNPIPQARLVDYPDRDEEDLFSVMDLDWI